MTITLSMIKLIFLLSIIIFVGCASTKKTIHFKLIELEAGSETGVRKPA